MEGTPRPAAAEPLGALVPALLAHGHLEGVGGGGAGVGQRRQSADTADLFEGPEGESLLLVLFVWAREGRIGAGGREMAGHVGEWGETNFMGKGLFKVGRGGEGIAC